MRIPKSYSIKKVLNNRIYILFTIYYLQKINKYIYILYLTLLMAV